MVVIGLGSTKILCLNFRKNYINSILKKNLDNAQIKRFMVTLSSCSSKIFVSVCALKACIRGYLPNDNKKVYKCCDMLSVIRTNFS